MERLKEILAVVNNKGGVGKTTTVQSLAAAIVKNLPGARVLVIDLDPQRHLSLLMGWQADRNFFTTPTIYTAMRHGGPLPVYATRTEGICLVPGDSALQDIDADLMRQMSPKRVLAKCFRQPVDDRTGLGLGGLIESFDYVLMDCAPALSQTAYNAMTVATGLLVPVQMEGLAVNGLFNILDAMKDVREELNPKLELRGLVPTMVDGRPRIVRGFIDYLRRSYGDRVTRTMIRRSIRVNEAQTLQQDIYAYAGNTTTVGLDYEMLAGELFGFPVTEPVKNQSSNQHKTA